MQLWSFRALQPPLGCSCSVFEWGFSGNNALKSLIGGVDFVGQRFKRVEFHPPHLYRKGNKLKSSPGRNCRKKSMAVCVAEGLSSCHTN